MGKVYSMTIKYLDSKRISTSGTPANYWDFDGSNDYVSTPDLLNVNTYTVSGWISADSTGDTWFKSGDSTNGDTFIGMTGSKASVTSYYTGGADSLNGSTDVPSGWNHVVAIRDASTSTLKIYLNGTLDGSMSLTQTNANYYTNNEHFIGKRLGSGGGAWDGKISFVTVWHRALSVSEITELYNSGGTSVIPTTNLVAHYNFAQTGSTLTDQANSNDGTNNGAITGGTRTVTQDKPTNVQDNSILVEKDTGERYWFDADAETETESSGTYSWTGDIGTYDNNHQGFYVANSSSIVYGKTITSVSFWLHKTGSPTGTATVGVWSSSGSGTTITLAHTFGTLDVSTLTGSFVKYTFDTGSHTLAVGDTVGIYSPTTNVSNTVEMQGAISGQYDGVNTIRGRTAGGTWSPVTTHDIRFAITEITPTWSLEGLEKFYDTTATASNVDLLILASGGHATRAGMKILAGSSAIGKYVQNIKFKLSKFTSPSGNYQITVRDSSDTVKATANFSATGLPTSATIIDHDIGSPVKLAEGDRILFEYGGGAGTKFWLNDSSGVSGFAITYYNYSSAYVDDSTDQVIGAMDSQQ
jgi:hypothetical protein